MFWIRFPLLIQGSFTNMPGHLVWRLRINGSAWALPGFQPQNHYLTTYASVSKSIKWGGKTAYLIGLLEDEIR